VGQQLDKATALGTREAINMDGKKNRGAMAAFIADITSRAEAQFKKSRRASVGRTGYRSVWRGWYGL
jgi:hypothetical protein